MSAPNDFLRDQNLTKEMWEKAGYSWETLEAIGADHLQQQDKLTHVAQSHANLLQSIPLVHSVRFRVKAVDHLQAKIIRKAAGGSAKYEGLDASSYHAVVGDLVGVRALHLFKDDCFVLDQFIKANCNVVGKPKAYIREGDSQTAFEEAGFVVAKHDHGYRSVHYDLTARLFQRETAVELQVRTVFEEGWSEVDHQIRYPLYSNDPRVADVLQLLNRLAGSADEAGTLVNKLNQETREAQGQYDSALQNIRKLTSELSQAKADTETLKLTIDALEAQVDSFPSLVPAQAFSGLGYLPPAQVLQPVGRSTEAMGYSTIAHLATPTISARPTDTLERIVWPVLTPTSVVSHTGASGAAQSGHEVKRGEPKKGED